MRAVNLLPRGAYQGRSIREEDPAVVVGSALGVIVLIALAAGFLTTHSRVVSEEKQLSAAQIELGKLSLKRRAVVPTPKPSKPTKPIIPVPAVTAEEQPRLAAVTQALSTRIAWDRILREFSLVVPSDVTIVSLSMTSPVSATSAATASTSPGGSGGQGLQITGNAYSHDSVARLLSRLMLIPDLTDVTLSNSSGNGDGPVTFSMSASVKGAPPPPAPAVTTPATGTTATTTGAAS